MSFRLLITVLGPNLSRKPVKKSHLFHSIYFNGEPSEGDQRRASGFLANPNLIIILSGMQQL